MWAYLDNRTTIFELFFIIVIEYFHSLSGFQLLLDQQSCSLRLLLVIQKRSYKNPCFVVVVQKRIQYLFFLLLLYSSVAVKYTTWRHFLHFHIKSLFIIFIHLVNIHTNITVGFIRTLSTNYCTSSQHSWILIRFQAIVNDVAAVWFQHLQLFSFHAVFSYHFLDRSYFHDGFLHFFVPEVNWLFIFIPNEGWGIKIICWKKKLVTDFKVWSERYRFIM